MGGGHHEAIPAAEFDAIAEAITGRRPQVATSRELRGDARRLNKYPLPNGGGTGYEIFIRNVFPARAGMNRVTNPILQRTSRVPEQALNSDAIRAAMLATMLAQGGLWEAFRQRSGAAGHT